MKVSEPKIVGVLGSCLLIAGVFTPLYIIGGGIDGVDPVLLSLFDEAIAKFSAGSTSTSSVTAVGLLLIAALSLLFALRNTYQYLWYTGGSAVLLVGTTYVNTSNWMEALHDDTTRISIVTDFVCYKSTCELIDYTWMVLILGTVFLLASAARGHVDRS